MNNKTIVIFLSLFFFLGCAKKEKDEAVLVVNGKKILRSQIEQAAEIMRQSMVRSFPQKALEGFDSELFKGAARQLIANEVLYKEAKKRNIVFNSEMIDSTVSKIKKQFSNKETYEKELASMGETEKSMRKQLEKGALIDSLLKSLSGEADTVSEEECLEFYRKDSSRFKSSPQIRVSQIFFPVDTAQGKELADSVEQLASKICKRAKDGEKFSDLAKKYSKGPAADSGGDMGWFKSGDLRSELETAVISTKNGEICGPVSSDAGYHILVKTDEKSPETLPFDKVKPQIYSMMQMKKKNDFMVSYIDSLIKKSEIKYLDKDLKPSREQSENDKKSGN